MEVWLEGFCISDDPTKLRPERVHAMLQKSYWAAERSLETIERSMEHSLCFGVYFNGEQIGFARCVTDYATMFWLCDVIVDERYRGRGLGKALIEAALNHEKLRGLKGFLATRTAQGLYARYGFEPLDVRFYRKREAPAPE